MFGFSKKCPVCKMELEKDKNHPEGYGKKFCSENCREEYRKKLAKEQSQRSSGGRCH
ncbi:MAG: hypothetical protein Q8M83_03600 [bacterium]|nr:hypothetical protein [bacterium]